MEENIVFNKEDVSSNRAFGILAYLGFLFLVPLFAAKDSPYARFHTNQGLVLFLFSIAANIVITICTLPFSLIPFIASIVRGLLGSAVGIICLVYVIIGIINACSGEAKKLPIIGRITLIQ